MKPPKVFLEAGTQRKPNSRVYARVYILKDRPELGLFWKAQAIRHAEAGGFRAKFEQPKPQPPEGGA